MSKTNASNGIGLLGFVFLIFLFLKLAGIGVVATWSWWWVTAPLWGGMAIVLGIWLIVVAAILIIGLFKGTSWLLFGKRKFARQVEKTVSGR